MHHVAIPDDWRESNEDRKEPLSKYYLSENSFREFDAFLVHGRHCVFTFKFKDGTKTRARGNGKVSMSNKPRQGLTLYARKIITKDRYHPMREDLGLNVGRGRKKSRARKKVAPMTATSEENNA